MKKRYSYRAYPTSRQRRDLSRLFGCCRYIYNSVIADRQAMYEVGLYLEKEPKPTAATPERTVSTFNANRQTALITNERALKPWLANASSVALIQSARDAEQSFKNFFNSVTGKRKGPKIGFPKKKSRFSGKQSARFTSNGFRLEGNRLFIAKIGWIPFVLSRELPSDPSSVTITMRPNGHYFVSFVVEADAVTQTSNSSRHAALDVGLTSFASIVYSDGTRESIDNPRLLRNKSRKLSRAQRKLSRMQGPDKRTRQKASKGWLKQRKIVNNIHNDVKNARADFARKLALKLARENDTIAVENLNLRGLTRSGPRSAQGRGLRKSLHDAAWGAFFRALHEKASGRVIAVNPTYTTQTCSCCGSAGGKKQLSVRQWQCQYCGAELDRDFNAAVNILLAAGHAESINAGGEATRLQLAEV